MRTPPSLAREHAELHAELDRITKLPGRTGEAARELVRIMRPHFERESEYATPPLGLLPRLARGQITAQMADVLPLVERLRTELPLMHEEHRAIVGALENLMAAATNDGHPQCAELAERLRLHAQTEEEILYPAAVLVGEFVKLKLRR